MARLVPLLELTVAASLLARGSRRGACAAGAALAARLCRGDRDQPAARAAAIWRAAAAARMSADRSPRGWCGATSCWRALLAALLLPWSGRPLNGADALTIGAGTAVAALLYMSLERLFGRVAPRTALAAGGTR